MTRSDVMYVELCVYLFESNFTIHDHHLDGNRRSAVKKFPILMEPEASVPRWQNPAV